MSERSRIAHVVRFVRKCRWYGCVCLRDQSALWHKARNDAHVGSMIDEALAPPEGFRFFYKGNANGTNLVVPTLDAPRDEMEAAFDGVLQAWFGDWSFMGRVPVRQNPDKYPTSVNMFDVINNVDPGGVPSEITNFLQNFDFFSQYMSGYYTKEHPRNY